MVENKKMVNGFCWLFHSETSKQNTEAIREKQHLLFPSIPFFLRYYLHYMFVTRAGTAFYAASRRGLVVWMLFYARTQQIWATFCSDRWPSRIAPLSPARFSQTKHCFSDM